MYNKWMPDEKIQTDHVWLLTPFEETTEHFLQAF